MTFLFTTLTSIGRSLACPKIRDAERHIPRAGAIRASSLLINQEGSNWAAASIRSRRPPATPVGRSADLRTRRRARPIIHFLVNNRVNIRKEASCPRSSWRQRVRRETGLFLEAFVGSKTANFHLHMANLVRRRWAKL